MDRLRSTHDRVTLQIQSLERGLDGRALPIEVRAGNLPFMDQATGLVPTLRTNPLNPFTGFILPGAGASGINIIDSRLQNPKVHQMSLGIQRQLGRRQVVRVDVVHNHGTDFIIGRIVGNRVQPGRRRSLPCRQSRVECGDRLRCTARRVRTTLYGLDSGSAPHTRYRLPITTPTTITFPSAAARSTRTTSDGSTDRHRTLLMVGSHCW